ncbi:hypothetical protein PMIN01_03397 [Paraphaeosphaeria minitans]|uniref:DUF7924 domain-containing protein n=1 Tax=Paraphaeosphaeria minitans TaxID=565426 RepID=A0A9P6KTU1_9PLEO|nr:hypothetical protein PMIN01_03397 [Paraphaeosphaeria minitans]
MGLYSLMLMAEILVGRVHEPPSHGIHCSDMSDLSAAWNPDLRPIPPTFEDILASSHTLPSSHESSPPTSEYPPLLIQDPILPRTPVLSPPSNVPSDCTADDPNCISVPKPDIAIGLSHASFCKLQGKILWEFQDNDRGFSEPHQSGIGLHFPFLIAEAKGLAMGSNLAGPQNQAAVDAACALNILRDLKLAANSSVHYSPKEQASSRQVLFSIVTEGPIHELWVH